ncbi:XkdF-like putative serine protease domain-containing protein [Halobacterium sp. KA-6]|uniref:XkdF-like putative serine protease domain-containing protein n=1 Tax=Halobacterium sp. KA-6 TaxID=2896368 RepID=UPI001E2BE390|nr:XkdF-like putative serine protease domain-containing protein [Halobacterium sp. KA-6]MCD2204417.1 XkdF-like putative serine protease domain-containing protein [Halobacterium sp. KA-6]
MPPVTKAGGQAFQKNVEFAEKDDSEQKAAGIVMVPDKADLQNDFAREDTIRGFADQFETFEEAGEAGGGIMHAVFPDDWLSLERNEVLDTAEEIGGQEVPEGAWVQEWEYHNDELWSLVEDGILAGYSIGARSVDWDGPYEQDELDDVDTSELPDDEVVYELVDGLMREVSTVDIPAVPDAMILDTKTAAVEKRLGSYLGDPNGFVEEALERGHSEEDAERLWDVLSTAVEVEGAREPGEKSVFERVGKAVLDALPGSGKSPGEAARVSETSAEDPRGGQAAKDATGGDTPDNKDGDGGDVDASDNTTDMSDNDPTDDDGGSNDAKELAEQNAEQINELTQAVDNLTKALTGPQPKTAEIEIDGETYEVPEDQVKAAFGVDEDTDKTVAEAFEELKSEVEANNTRIDSIARQSGGSNQVDPAAAKGQGGGEGDEDGGLDRIGKALS